jgi:hypothetical protein
MSQAPVQLPPGADPAAVAAHAPTAPQLATVASYRNGRLTHDGMRLVIARGGSVIHNGNVVNRIEDLPSEVQLSRDNASADRRHVAERRIAVARRETDARTQGTYELDKHDIEAEKAAIDKEAARITTASHETEADAMKDIEQRQAALDAEKAQLQAAQAAKPAVKK